MKELKNFQKRVISEKDELKERILNLGKFIATNPIFETLPGDERKDMTEQIIHMRNYLDCLERRIKRF